MWVGYKDIGDSRLEYVFASAENYSNVQSKPYTTDTGNVCLLLINRCMLPPHLTPGDTRHWEGMFASDVQVYFNPQTDKYR